MLQQDLFDPALRNHQRKPVETRNVRKIDSEKRPISIANAKDWNLYTLCQQVAGHAERFQYLHSPSMNHARTRGIRTCRLLIDDHGVNAAPFQLRGQSKARRSRADYENPICGFDIKHEAPSCCR